MHKKARIVLKNIMWPLLAVLLLLLVWSVVAASYGNHFLVPNPRLVFSEAIKLLGEGVFWSAFFASLKRCMLALLLSFLLALILSVISVLWRPLHRLLIPIVTVLRAVPTMSVIFILILIFSPKTAPIYVTFLVVMPSMYSMLISAFLAVPKELIEAGRVFGYGKIGEVVKVHIPLSLPIMIESIASGFSLSFKILVAAEVLSSTANSVGYLLTLANMNIEMARLIAITIITITVCIGVELSLRLLNDRLSKNLY